MSRENPASTLPIVEIITTGGTIASRMDARLGAAVPALQASELLSSVSGLADYARIRSTELSLVSSWNLTMGSTVGLAHRVAAVLAEDDVAGVVVTQGTDTMEETSFVLDLLVDSEKPVVVTGAMRNASHQGADGPRNLLAAVRLAVDRAARGLGAVVVMNDEIHAARYVTKTHTTALDTFRSPDLGAVGSIDEKGVWLRWRPSPLPKLAVEEPASGIYLVKMALGMEDHLLRAALAAGARGVVVEGSGAGNVYEGWEEAIGALVASGTPVVLVSRCPGGRIVPAYGGGGGGRTLREAGTIDGGWLSGPKARVALALALGAGMDPGEVRKYFARLTA